MREKLKFNSEALGAMVSSKRKWEKTGIREAAAAIGTSAATLSRIENGRIPDIITCKLICDWLHVDMNFFFKVRKKAL